MRREADCLCRGGVYWGREGIQIKEKQDRGKSEVVFTGDR